VTSNKYIFKGTKTGTLLTAALLLFLLALTGCTKPEPPAETETPPAEQPSETEVFEKEALSALLPAEIGYTWIYNGFAEYGHTMTLDALIESENSSVYEISGDVADMSGGEGNLDTALTIKYILSGNTLVQEKTEEMMLDSKFDKLTLIQTPLAAGNTWTEEVSDPDTGETVTLSSTIEAAEMLDGAMQYTVRYEDTASNYYELRVLREGVGVISVEKLLQLTESDFPAGYSLYKSGMLSEVTMDLYFGAPNADGVLPESRTLLISDGAVARAAIEALLWGPQSPDLYPTLPEGTRLLDISIADGTCTVDFSQEFLDNHPGGSAGELMTLGSIVQTLKQFDGIERVQILVEGRTGETLGHVLLDEPLE
jgi:hypothetical protein